MIGLWIAWHNIRRTLGGIKSFITLVLVPVFVISGVVGLFGQSASGPARIAVTSADAGEYGAMLLAGLRDEPSYIVEFRPGLDAGTLRGMVRDGEAHAAILVPEGYSAGLLRGEAPELELYRKTEQTWNAALVLELEAEMRRMEGLAGAALRSSDFSGADPKAALDRLLEAREAAAIPAEAVQVVKGSSEGFTLVVGLMLMFVMALVNQSMHGVLEDRANRTMARMYVAPVRAWQIALGNFLGSLLLGLLQLTSILAIVRYVLGFDLGVPFGAQLLVMTCFLLAAVGIASAVASIVRSASQVGQINNLVVVPTCMLGGCFWPVTLMPDFMQKLASFTPQRWAIKALEELSTGASIGDIGLHLAILLLIAVLLLASGAYVLQPSRSSL